ncbi:MAG: hypothetical protein ACHQFZ_02230 [Acidimicrobiales bacterium]
MVERVQRAKELRRRADCPNSVSALRTTSLYANDKDQPLVNFESRFGAGGWGLRTRRLDAPSNDSELPKQPKHAHLEALRRVALVIQEVAFGGLLESRHAWTCQPSIECDESELLAAFRFGRRWKGRQRTV